VLFTLIAFPGQSITDCSGNAIATSFQIFYIGFEPQTDDVIINEIFADPVPVIGLPSEEYVELYNVSDKLIDLAGCSFDGSTINSGIMESNTYVILCDILDTALFSPFGAVIGLSSWPALTNGGELITLENPSGIIIDEVEYDISWYNDEIKNNGGYSLELINPEAICSGGSYNWTASQDPSGGTPGNENSVFDNSPDLISPDLSSIEVISDTSITLYFSEPMDTLSLLNGTYIINSGLSVVEININEANIASVILILSSSIDTSITYTVMATNLIDCPGNAISVNNTGTFLVSYTPIFGEVIINEIFANPSPQIVFPKGEFVLFNTTDKLFDLSGYTFDGATINSGFIDPNGYVTLCHENDTAGFGIFGKTIGLSSFPSLTNKGELITFEDPNDITIDAVEYEVTWHTESEKENGGWSLELINPNNPCSGNSNWGSSISFDGATPGYQNSIYDISDDITAPSLLTIEVTGSNLILLTFNEPIDTNNIDLISVSITPSLTIDSIGVANTAGDVIFIRFTSDIAFAVNYMISVANMEDCIGNLNTIGSSLTFEIGYVPSPGDLIINEIFIDPSPIIGLPEAEFIEIYNKSDKKIDLSYAELNGKSINRFLLFPDDYVIITDDDDTSLFAEYSNVVAINSWITLNNTSMQLTLTNTNNEVIDNVYYFSSWYNDDEKDSGGWSLERKNPESKCNFANNWAVSIDNRGGTPGEQNSVYIIEVDIVSPYVTKVDVIDSVTLKISFSESMDVSSALSASYNLDYSNEVVTFAIDSTDFTSIVLGLKLELLQGDLQNIVISGAKDCPGNIMDTTSVQFVLPQEGIDGDLVINEVLFNPLTNGEDFVEIYNNSNKYIDVGTWYLANFADDTISSIKSISSEQQIIAPGQFYAITKDSMAVKSSYPLAAGGNYIQASSLPTYGNSDGVVILLNNSYEQMDRFDYDENMHFAILNTEEGVSLERVDFNRPTNESTNWHSAAQSVGFATPGLPNSQYQPANPGNDVITVEPEIFSPDEDGYNDLLNISYQLDEAGYVGNISIYDTKGRLVRRLMINEYLTPEGTISWDGKTDNNEKARIGIYIVLAEFYNEAGNVIKAKKATVLGGQL